MTNAIVVGSLLLAAIASVVACSASTEPTPASTANDSSTLQTCVDFVVRDDETTCAADTDCTFIDALRVCPGDPSCGGQIPTNHAGSTRYGEETGALPRQQISCGRPADEACVGGRCVIKPYCPDGGAC